jgi:hypothetical protein
LIIENSNFEPVLQEQFLISELIQEKGITDPTTLNSVSPQGIQTMVLRGDEGSEFIEKNPENSSLYMIFRQR